MLGWAEASGRELQDLASRSCNPRDTQQVKLESPFEAGPICGNGLDLPVTSIPYGLPLESKNTLVHHRRYEENLFN